MLITILVNERELSRFLFYGLMAKSCSFALLYSNADASTLFFIREGERSSTCQIQEQKRTEGLA